MLHLGEYLIFNYTELYKLGKNQGAVGPSKSEAVRQDHIYLLLLCNFGHKVEIGSDVWLF